LAYKDTAKNGQYVTVCQWSCYFHLRLAEMNRTLSGLQVMIVGLIPEFLERRKSFSMLRWGQIEVKPLDGPTATEWIVSFHSGSSLCKSRATVLSTNRCRCRNRCRDQIGPTEVVLPPRLPFCSETKFTHCALTDISNPFACVAHFSVESNAVRL
jgi:hypothetical protein